MRFSLVYANAQPATDLLSPCNPGFHLMLEHGNLLNFLNRPKTVPAAVQLMPAIPPLQHRSRICAFVQTGLSVRSFAPSMSRGSSFESAAHDRRTAHPRRMRNLSIMNAFHPTHALLFKE